MPVCLSEHDVRLLRWRLDCKGEIMGSCMTQVVGLALVTVTEDYSTKSEDVRGILEA